MNLKIQQKFDSKILYVILKPFTCIKGYWFLICLVSNFLPRYLFEVKANIKIFNRNKILYANVNYPYMLDIFLKNKNELTIPSLIIKLLPKNSSFADVGANCGWYSRIVGAFRGDVNIYCFEPSKKAFFELTKISNFRIFAFPFCCSDEDDQKFHSKRRFFRQESGAKFMKILKINTRQFLAPSIKLDTFFSRIKTYPEIIKIDVEGAELNVLRGATKSLIHANYVFVEVNENVNCAQFNYEYDDIYKYLINCRFKYHYQIFNSQKKVVRLNSFVPGDILFSKHIIQEFE